MSTVTSNRDFSFIRKLAERGLTPAAIASRCAERAIWDGERSPTAAEIEDLVGTGPTPLPAPRPVLERDAASLAVADAKQSVSA